MKSRINQHFFMKSLHLSELKVFDKMFFSAFVYSTLFTELNSSKTSGEKTDHLLDRVTKVLVFIPGGYISSEPK